MTTAFQWQPGKAYRMRDGSKVFYLGRRPPGGIYDREPCIFSRPNGELISRAEGGGFVRDCGTSGLDVLPEEWREPLTYTKVLVLAIRKDTNYCSMFTFSSMEEYRRLTASGSSVFYDYYTYHNPTTITLTEGK